MSNSMKAIRVVRKISQSLCIVLLLLAGSALSAQTQEHRVRNIVLVHGAWADGSGRKGVYDISCAAAEKSAVDKIESDRNWKDLSLSTDYSPDETPV